MVRHRQGKGTNEKGRTEWHAPQMCQSIRLLDALAVGQNLTILSEFDLGTQRVRL